MDRLSTTTPTIPDYELIARIGSGAYGEVWLARNLATGAQRAVKIVYRATFTDERPFNREFEGIKKFEVISHSHPSQLSLFHVGRNKEAAYFYYVMELADEVGRDVLSAPRPYDKSSHPPETSSVPKSHSAMPNEKCSMLNAQSPPVSSYIPHTLRSDLEHTRLPATRVLEIALALTEALSHLHQNGLIHRDVKPSNIIFIQGRPKLADIGLVTDASDSRSIVGTEGYLPAEGPGTPQADLFALGKVLYETLTGLDRRQYPELPADLRTWPDAKLAFELNTILLKLCAAHPRDRYPTAESLLADLKLLDAGKSVQRRRSFQRAISFTFRGTIAICLIALATYLIHTSRREPKLVVEKYGPFETSGTTNHAAWQALQRGRQIIGTYTAQGASNAIAEWEQAVQLDPNFASAWVMLSLGYSLSADRGYIPSSAALLRARACAETAIKLDPGYSGAYRALADCVLALEYDFPKAEALYRKALKIDPKNHSIKMILGGALANFGRFAEAEQLFLEALRDSPATGSLHTMLAMMYARQGRWDEAFSHFDNGVRLEPDRPSGYFGRGVALWQNGRREPGARDLLRTVELDGFACLDRNDDARTLRKALDEGGPDRFARQMVDLMESRRKSGQFVSALELARFHALAGDREEALNWLEKTPDEHRMGIVNNLTALLFSDFRDEPRYRAVLRRVNLE